MKKIKINREIIWKDVKHCLYLYCSVALRAEQTRTGITTMSLNFHDLSEERRIDREGYECEICERRSHTEVNRHPELHEGLICERCADRLAAEQEAEQEAEENSDFFNHAVELVRGQK